MTVTVKTLNDIIAPPHAAAQGQTQAMAITVQACRPKSRGRLTLRSDDPLDAPVIDPGYLTHRDDMTLQIEGVRAARKIAAALPLREHIVREMSPGPGAIDEPAEGPRDTSTRDTAPSPSSSRRERPR